MPAPPSASARLTKAARGAATFAAAIAVVVLAGWVLDVPSLRGPIPGLIEMKFNTAIGFLLGAVAVWVLADPDAPAGARRLVIPAALLTAVIGVLSLAQYVLGADLGIDELVFSDPREPGNDPTVHPGRLAPPTALIFGILGAGLLLAGLRTRAARTAARVLGLTAGAISFFAILATFYRAEGLAAIGPFSPPALHTATAALALSFGLVCATAGAGTVQLLTGSGPSGVSARRLLPLAIIGLPLLGWLRIEGERSGLYDANVGVALMVLVAVAAFAAAVLGIGRELARTDLERRRAEIALQAAKEDAERANHAKSEFLSRVSHELRTPLGAVLGFAQLLEREGLEGRQRESVDRIVKGGRHLLDLINELLDISRIESGTLMLSLEPVDLVDLLESAIELMEPVGAERRVRIERSLGDGGGCYALADVQRLRQVILNLLSNAIKYNREAGLVSVALAERPGGRLAFSITDEGAGLAEDDIDRLFSPFERLGAEETQVEGTGLGLALSKRLVEAMNGTITAEVAPGGGMRFTVDLERSDPPGSDGAVTRREPVATRAELGESRRMVLYIEDNLANSRLLERLLADAPHVTVLPAMHGRLGIELARRHQPDLILLDLDLPDVPGIEILERLKRDPATRDLPVVVVSADADERREQRLLRAGARAYLTKPLDLDRLLDAAGEHVGLSAPRA